MKIEYDRSACSAWFQCIRHWDAFEANTADRKADLRTAEQITDGIFVLEVPIPFEGDAIAAAEACPVGAIRLYDDDGNRVAPAP